MSVYIVTYDLNTPGQEYGPLIAAIKKYTHCKCLKSAFFIDTSDKASEIMDKLKPLVDSNDLIYVMELQKHWSANKKMACTTWLKDSSRTWD